MPYAARASDREPSGARLLVMADVIDCGPGKDQVTYDKGLDSVKQAGCEKKLPARH